MTQRGFLGVDLFFVLSGFLIVTLLLRERDERGSVSIQNFFLRRALRIFPLYYLLIFVVGAVAWVADRGTFRWATYAEALPFLLTYTVNWVEVDASVLDVAWSLATEEQFYLVWPWIIALVAERGARRAVGIALVANVALAMGLEHRPLPILQVTFTPILLGVLLAHLLHDRSDYERLYRLLGRPYAASAFGLGLLVLVNIPNPDISGLHRTAIHLAMVGFLGSLVVNERVPGWPWLRAPIVARMGAISYGLYLWHMLAQTLAFRVIRELSWTQALLSIALTFLLAEVSFRWFETPFLRVKAQLSRV